MVFQNIRLNMLPFWHNIAFFNTISQGNKISNYPLLKVRYTCPHIFTASVWLYILNYFHPDIIFRTVQNYTLLKAFDELNFESVLTDTERQDLQDQILLRQTTLHMDKPDKLKADIIEAILGQLYSLITDKQLHGMPEPELQKTLEAHTFKLMIAYLISLALKTVFLSFYSFSLYLLSGDRHHYEVRLLSPSCITILFSP